MAYQLATMKYSYIKNNIKCQSTTIQDHVNSIFAMLYHVKIMLNSRIGITVTTVTGHAGELPRGHAGAWALLEHCWELFNGKDGGYLLVLNVGNEGMIHNNYR